MCPNHLKFSSSSAHRDLEHRLPHLLQDLKKSSEVCPSLCCTGGTCKVTHTHTHPHMRIHTYTPLTVMSLPRSFAHLINLEFFDDLLSILQSLIQSGVSNEPAVARLGSSSISAAPKSVCGTSGFHFLLTLTCKLFRDSYGCFWAQQEQPRQKIPYLVAPLERNSSLHLRVNV